MCSSDLQADTFASEFLMPFEECKTMEPEEICKTYHVSRKAAEVRYEKNKKADDKACKRKQIEYSRFKAQFGRKQFSEYFLQHRIFTSQYGLYHIWRRNSIYIEKQCPLWTLSFLYIRKKAASNNAVFLRCFIRNVFIS